MRKPLIFLLVLPCLNIQTSHGAVLSETNDGIFIAIDTWPPPGNVTNDNSPFPFDKQLAWEAYSLVGPVEFNIPRPSFGIRMEMYDANGRKIAMTALGRSYGSKYDQVKNYADVLVGTDMGGMFANEKPEAKLPLDDAALLPSPSKLFQIKDPGLYNLKIQIQMFEILKTTASHWDRQLLKFSKIRVIQIRVPE